MECEINKLDSYYQNYVKKNLVKEPKEMKDIKRDDCLTMVDCLGLKLKNRYVVAVMSDGEFFDGTNITNRYFEFYNKLAKSDVGLIFTGGVYDASIYKKSSTKPVINYGEGKIDVWKNHIEEIHSYGAKIMITIKPNFGRSNGGIRLFDILSGSPSFNKNYNDSRLICARLSDGKCDEIVSKMRRVSTFAKRAGFDGVVIDGGFEEVLGEFSSKEFNKRIFGYYAETKDLAVKCTKTISAQMGSLPIIYKISLQSFLNEVYEKNIKQISTIKNVNKFSTVCDLVELIKELVKFGVDAFYFQIGTFETEFLNESFTLKNNGLFDSYIDSLMTYLNSLQIKNKYGEAITFILKNDEINSLKNNNYLCDVTKNIYADQDYIIKEKTQKLIKKCIKCNKCIDFKQKYCKNACIINPELKHNLLSIGNSASESIAIVGGGISGMVCALTIANRGGKCDIIERGDSLNALGELKTIFGYDDCMKNYNNYLKCEILKNAKNNKINIKTDTDIIFDTNFIKKYSTIIVATGAHEKCLNVNGAIQKHVVSIYDFLKKKPKDLDKKQIAIYVKTELGLKLAVYLAKIGLRVSVLVDDKNLLTKIPNANLTFYLEAFNILRVDIVLISRIKKINEDSVDVFVNNKLKGKDITAVILNMKSKKEYSYLAELKTIDADLFIYEPYLVSNNKLYYDLVKNRYPGKVYLIGDALEVGDLEHSIKTGFYVGKNI